MNKKTFKIFGRFAFKPLREGLLPEIYDMEFRMCQKATKELENKPCDECPYKFRCFTTVKR